MGKPKAPLQLPERANPTPSIQLREGGNPTLPLQYQEGAKSTPPFQLQEGGHIHASLDLEKGAKHMPPLHVRKRPNRSLHSNNESGPIPRLLSITRRKLISRLPSSTKRGPSPL